MELIKLLLDMGEREQDRLWSAFGHMLTLNGGLFVLAGLLFENCFNPLSYRLLAIVGAIVCMCAIMIVHFAKQDARRWQIDAGRLIFEDVQLRESITALPKKPRLLNATGTARGLLGLLAIVWLGLAATSFFVPGNPTCQVTPSASEDVAKARPHAPRQYLATS